MSTPDTQLFKVMCPYCTVGHAVVDVQKKNGAHSASTGHRQCSMCRRYFQIKVHLRLQGMPLESVDRDKAFRNAIKEML